ncbi:larval/pupal rigid cuticle protein 66-like [Aricia agestis]|uniref:larval/pupal rigid cuticle protein 66-like n=1 Tax=Aricia agestis TaxID=91739 RepID=UPI001C20AAB9|nr:larval/pupal rigid cuticle protein 66-like [Aricia agestis]
MFAKKNQILFSFQVVVFSFLVAVAHSSAIGSADSSSFSYGVSDPLTGDVKSQQETRVGDSVVGQYSLLDSDGTRRTVQYSADAQNGFNAVVRKDPAYAAVVPAAPVVTANVAYAQAPVAYAQAPVAYAQAPVAYAQAPVAYAQASVAYSPVVSAPLAYAARGYAKLY